MIDLEKVRDMFEQKMRWVEQQTGKTIKLQLMMAGGPEHSNIVYEQMFACYLAGFEASMKESNR